MKRSGYMPKWCKAVTNEVSVGVSDMLSDAWRQAIALRRRMVAGTGNGILAAGIRRWLQEGIPESFHEED